MKSPVCIAVLLSLTVWTSATLFWIDLAITAPQYGRYLYRTNTKQPFFWQADTAWELIHKLDKTSIDFYLRTRSEQGFNAVLAVVIAEKNGTM
ncbi:hypothetical protein P3T76_009758 [Phytophthora citrophthora]|uniref:Apiosidase-like catalytic domain-containing protein n=1 Tax=Phytophthora citrophthora TaxID=4793 RepID=A0AAD9LHV8_9STRA|nr:hypothetical protein P3T76_009758 [Phytophthora citrophthora]